MLLTEGFRQIVQWAPVMRPRRAGRLSDDCGALGIPGALERDWLRGLNTKTNTRCCGTHMGCGYP